MGHVLFMILGFYQWWLH